MTTFSVMTLNLHKGFSQAGKRLVLPELRDGLRAEEPDIVFLQEVVGENRQHASSVEGWPDSSQYEFLADQVWDAHSYGKNAVYEGGHHGNAILSKFPIVREYHHLISASHFEQRGILHVEVQLSENQRMHLICVHLGLLERWRQRQLLWISDYINQNIQSDAPIIVAGDFNDWRCRAGKMLSDNNCLRDPFVDSSGKAIKTYPARFPIFAMDRIYYTNIRALDAQLLGSKSWSRLSDHLPLQTHFSLS